MISSSRLLTTLTSTCLLLPLTAAAQETAVPKDPVVHTFERHQLTDVYFSEGANGGDINGDGIGDVVYGPHWFAGPDYKTKYEIYKPVPQNTARYADNFFSWLYDFNGDGKNDVFVVGFPGTPAYVHENPGKDGFAAHWTKHEVFDWVSNESPQLIDLIGDNRPELVCTRDGYFGFATIDWDTPFDTWKFHPISEQITSGRFGHGLGIGDVNGDGRNDVIHAKGWFEQPSENVSTSRWTSHTATFTSAYGGAEMYAYDVDGDGDNDIITSEAAHDFGLSWYEQTGKGDDVAFQRHVIMGSHPSENKHGVLFSELHSVALADMDGDGLKDIVTGKTYWSHHKQSPMWDAGAVVYWFKLSRSDDGVQWTPYQADDDAGIGRQVSIVDVNNDDLPDIVLGGMKGSHVLIHQTKSVSNELWLAAQPSLYTGPKLPSVEGAIAKRGPKPSFAANGSVVGAIEAETMNAKVTGGSARPQPMGGFSGDKWSGNSQLFWTGAKPGDELTLPLPEMSGPVDVSIVLTCAGDYGIVQLTLDGEPFGKPVDLFESNVMTTGILEYQKVPADSGQHKLGIQIAGANSKAKKSFMVGIDYVAIKPSK